MGINIKSLTIYNIDDFPYSEIKKIEIVKRPRGNNGGYAKGKFKNIICAFDIETTNIKKEKAAIMYAWAFDFNNIGTVIGRTWEEFKIFLNRLKKELNDDEKIVIYSHFLNFEFQFLSGIYKFRDNEVFATDRRDVLTCTMFNCFEFRCSYQKSGLKLEEYLKKWGVKHQKLKYDYNKPRYPHTKLTDEEWAYLIHDVKGLGEAIKAELEFYGDTLITTPNTKTGYIRRTAKRQLNGFAQTALKSQLLSMEIYPLLREAFRGGNCIDNRYTRNEIINKPQHADRSSSYPAVQLLPEFPIGAWKCANYNNLDKLLYTIYYRKKAIVARLAFENIKLIDSTNPAPYLMRTKCRCINGAKIDAGRILKAAYLETTVTEIDLEIILNQYTFDNIRIGEWWFNRKGKLPYQLIDLIIELYKKKTELKNKPGAELEYIAAKTELDSLYGLSVQDPCKRYYKLIDGKWGKDPRHEEVLLRDANRRAFLSYSYGVYTTALARRELQKAIDLAGDDFLYSDTDSIWTDGNLDLNKLNEPIIKAAKAAGAVALDYKGNKHYIGAWEKEKNVNNFKCLGAKRYATETRGKIEITLAGIDKEKGAAELKRRGGLEALEDGFTFYEAGGMEAYYNDYTKPRGVIIQGHKYTLRNNVYLQPRKITLGFVGELEMLLTRPGVFERIFENANI